MLGHFQAFPTEVQILLGCIGDDFTGSSDLGNVLAKGGMRTVQYSGVPRGDAGKDVEAGIVALKSRTADTGEAVRQSLEALAWLRAQGCRQILFKYCSTFDSTPQGNIGPVADALADALGAEHVVFCPAFPTLKRSIYNGHLFVADKLLNESGMQNHPLTPMTDADLRRWLARQSRSSVGHVGASVVRKGREAIRAALDGSSERFIIVDCLEDAELVEIGAAAADAPLITGGSGIALGLPENYRARGEIAAAATRWEPVKGPVAILSGSCSVATRAQIAWHRLHHPALEVSADEVMSGQMTPRRAVDWILGYQDSLPLVYSSAEPAVVSAAQERYGRYEVATALEQFMCETAVLAVNGGLAGIICAGGETSGAITQALGIEALEIGPEIDPGVPALRAVGRDLVLALKSGNFGSEDFFERAAGELRG